MEGRRKGKIIKGGDRETVLNVYTYLKKKYPDIPDTAVVKETCEATRTSQASFYRIKKEASKGPLTTPKKKREVTYKTSRQMKYNNFIRTAIRRHVHAFYFKNEPPTITNILHNVNSDEDLPDFKFHTFYRLIKEIGFTFEKRGNKSLMIERDDIIVWRHSYLRKIKQFRAEGRDIVYLDETWINAGHTVSKVWKDKTINTPKDAFLAGLSVGLKNPTARGPRYVIVHAGGKDGFIENSMKVFLAKKNTADYHDEMDSAVFETWFKQQLVPNLQQGTVIVMDNASYHGRKKEKVPTTSSLKGDIMNWLRSKNIEFPENALKKELMDIVNKFRSQFSSYEIDSYAKEYGMFVLRTPPYHCELNPIELVWSQLKRHVAQHNVKFKINLLEGLINDAFLSITSDHWKNYCKHVEEIEEGMWKADELQDDIEPLIIQLTDNSSSDDRSSSVSSTRNICDYEIEGVEPLPSTSSDLLV